MPTSLHPDAESIGLLEAQGKAFSLFDHVVANNLIRAGVRESELNQQIYDLAFDLFGIRKYWHKRIVRAGKNTLAPYRENPPDLILQEDDIVFLDFGPVFEDWEADVGRTYVLGNDARKQRLKADVERAFALGKQYFETHCDTITCSELYHYIRSLALAGGWNYDIPHAGHLIGRFPHERMPDDPNELYIRPDNNIPMASRNDQGQLRHWILEVHFLDPEHEIGVFVEALLTV
jgi:Xaa-Pro dipeptidase